MILNNVQFQSTHCPLPPSPMGRGYPSRSLIYNFYLFQIMACHQFATKPLRVPSHCQNQCCPKYLAFYVQSLGHNKFAYTPTLIHPTLVLATMFKEAWILVNMIRVWRNVMVLMKSRGAKIWRVWKYCYADDANVASRYPMGCFTNGYVFQIQNDEVGFFFHLLKQ